MFFGKFLNLGNNMRELQGNLPLSTGRESREVERLDWFFRIFTDVIDIVHMDTIP